MLLDEVIEHRCPDFVVPQQRAEAVETSIAKPNPREEVSKMLQWIRFFFHKTLEYIKIKRTCVMF